MEGRLIVLEGPDGAGKTTHAKLLAEWLRGQGREVVECREPGGTPIGEHLRTLLMLRENYKITPLAELFLFNAARAQLVGTVILPALARGAVVVCDRFTLSSLVYQGAARCSAGDVLDACRIATGGLVPDLTLILDAPSVFLAKRIEARDGEEACPSMDALEKLTNTYAADAIAMSFRRLIGRYVFVAAEHDMESVQSVVRFRVTQMLGLLPSPVGEEVAGVDLQTVNNLHEA